MLKRYYRPVALVALAAFVTAPVVAEVFDGAPQAGQVFQALDSVVAYGPDCDPIKVRVWIPNLLPETSSALNNAVVTLVDGDILGGVSLWSTAGSPNVIMYVGTADQLDANGGYTSNNVVINEFPESRSDTLGQILPDGALVYRANYAGTAQNNLEWVLGDVESQLPPWPEPQVGNEILSGPGTSGDPGSCYLGVPAAMYVNDGSGDMWVGNTNYDAGTGDVPVAANIWRYDGTQQPASTPAYSYLQGDAEGFANANGVPVDPGDGRQTQPAFAEVQGVAYIVFGINDTTEGGSGRPKMLAIDAFEDGDGFTNAVPVIAAAGERFIDHKATGGGGSPYENKHFDMNSAGQLVIVSETIATVPTYKLWLYEPIFTAGRITGFAAPTLIADAGPDDTIDDGLGGPIMSGDPPTAINAISGVGINDAGNIAFTATYDTGEVDDNGDPILSSAAYFYDAAGGCLHQVLREDDLISFGANTVAIGLIPQEDSDSFFATGLADNADVMTFNFRPSLEPNGGVRGTLVLALGHEGDTDFDGDVDQSDLGTLLATWGASFGEPGYDPEVDFNLDGVINQSDLGILLANWNP